MALARDVPLGYAGFFMASAVCLLRGRGMAQARDVPLGYAGFFMASAVCPAAVAWRLHKTYKTYKIMVGAPVFALLGYAAASHEISRGFAGRCVVWLGGKIYRWVVLCLLDSNGGMRVAGAWRLHKTYKTYKTYKIMVGGARLRPAGLRRGKPRYTPWVCLPSFGMAREMIYHRGMRR